VSQFLPYRNGWECLSPFVRELQIIGSDVVNFSCPSCWSYDRERHLVMYFDALSLWARFQGATVLHFAPEKHLTQRIQEQGPRNYIRADLSPKSPDLTPVDVTQIPYPDGSFDFLICNHVLEHVPDDRRALSEIYRVLRPGGHAVLQTPFSPLLRGSFEDPGIDTDELRNYCYAQEDHVRLYGQDLFTRIEAAGFTLAVRQHREFFSEGDSAYYGVNPREDLILVRKEAKSWRKRLKRRAVSWLFRRAS
jgi:SAM-dependent methyltransferase